MPKIKQLKSKLVITGLVLLFAVGLYVTPMSCVFFDLFGIRCLGCGMTRALIAALQFDFKSAVSHHFMFWSLPVLYLCFLYDGKLFSKRGWNLVTYLLLAAGFLLNWVLHLIP